VELGGLQYFTDVGFCVSGCDLSPINVEFGRNKGLDIHCGNFEMLMSKLVDRVSDVGLVIYEQVFEHLADPRRELEKLRNWLPQEAILYIGVPGFKNIEKHYGADFLRYLQIPHLCHYELRTLTELLQSEGYSVLVGDETARIVARYSGAIRSVAINSQQSKDVRNYLKNLEIKRLAFGPRRAFNALCAMPVELGLKIHKSIERSECLPLSFKYGSSLALKAIYHRFFK
jgi:SAM-dependent methyltransferase